MEWSQQQSRNLPWKTTSDPYKIWLSEIILQQTRVAQGMPYYLKFIDQYPTITALAAAPEDEVFRLWEGLGYYSRARNMMFTARYIVDELGGKFPDTYAGLRALKGIGDYTAAAIASFAYGLPYAVLDGNVYRVLSRYFGIATPINSTSGKKEFDALAQALLYRKDPAAYNQAIMDFGATQCTPQAPLCPSCPLHTQCVGWQTGKMLQLPVKEKTITLKTRYFNYIVFTTPEKQTYIEKRTQSDIWQGLYQFPMLETSTELLNLEQLLYQPQWLQWTENTPIAQIVPSSIYRQKLTHQNIQAHFFEVMLPQQAFIAKAVPTSWQLIDCLDISQYAFPKIIHKYLDTTAQSHTLKDPSIVV